MANISIVEKEIDEIIERYYEDDHYRRYRSDEEDNEFDIADELQDYCIRNHVEFEISEEDGFDSPGYSNAFIAIAFKANNSNNFGSSLFLKTVMIESF